ncbi:T9SS type A sorting domain-containing protein [Flavobacterium sp.]|uniref:T9SS type A sorting domain-containing protein n=1 Tax=Flavobacterium sp. TaxID=239 RepID=UPI002631ACA7|nr:T9SS type A sorting domain-containing protein [Flavobacterium sp.]
MKIKLLLSFLLINVFLLANAATPPDATIYYNSPVCSASGLITVVFSGTTGGTFSASSAGLSINPVTGTIDPQTSLPGSYEVSYSIPPDMVNPAFVTTTPFIIVAEPYPGINGTISICEDNVAPIYLPSIIAVQNSVGTWTRFSGTGGTFDAATGTFTPGIGATTSQFVYTVGSGGPCMAMTSMATVVINPVVYPTFVPIAPICQGDTPPALPAVSANGISGTWNPSAISTLIPATTTYTFTPNSGGCGLSQNLAVTVTLQIVPTFSFSSATICSGNVPVLPSVSTNGVTGTWSPSTVTATGTYVFTPDAGQCATTTTVALVVSPAPYATITGNTTICQGTSATVTFAGMPNSVVSYTTDSGPLQSIVLNATGTAIITTPPLNANSMICLVSASSPGNCTTAITGCAIINVVANVVIPPMPNVTACGQYILPALQIGNYYTAPNGGGTMLYAGDVITNTQVIYVYFPGICSSNEESFVVVILPMVNPTISTVDNINYIIVEDNQILQALQLNTEVQTGNYSYQWIESQNDIIGANSPSYTVNNLLNGGLHHYSVRVTNNDTNCVSQSPAFQVFEIPVPAPVGDSNQTFTLGQTLADVIVSGQNIQWYDVFNRNATSNPLPLNTPLVAGVTYYATQTINGHESASAFEITIQFLANDSFAFKDLKFSPNPVQDVLYIQSKDLIQDVSVFNIMGQKVLQQNFDSLDLRLPLGQLKTGNYFIKLESDNKSQVIKVIKEY